MWLWSRARRWLVWSWGRAWWRIVFWLWSRAAQRPTQPCKKLAQQQPCIGAEAWGDSRRRGHWGIMVRDHALALGLRSGLAAHPVPAAAGCHNEHHTNGHSNSWRNDAGIWALGSCMWLERGAGLSWVGGREGAWRATLCACSVHVYRCLFYLHTCTLFAS